MVMASMRAKGSCSMITRSLKVPGSDSSALQIRYRSRSNARATASHLRPVGNAAPPRPRSFDSVTSRITAAGPISMALRRAS